MFLALFCLFSDCILTQDQFLIAIAIQIPMILLMDELVSLGMFGYVSGHFH